jgi:hypothetical protein
MFMSYDYTLGLPYMLFIIVRYLQDRVCIHCINTRSFNLIYLQDVT